MGGEFGGVRGRDRQPWPPPGDRPGAGARPPARAVRTPTARHGGLVALAACIGIWLVTSGSREPVGPPLPSPAEALTAAGVVGPGIAPLPGSPPGRIRIPSIRVDAPLTGLGLERDGSLEVPPPDRRDLAGWYREGTTPGATGTAVIAGHVDDAAGPGVFYHLGALHRGPRSRSRARTGVRPCSRSTRSRSTTPRPSPTPVCTAPRRGPSCG